MQRTPAPQSQEGRLFALQQERDRLERYRQLGIQGYDSPGFTDQFTAPINDEIAWAAGYGMQGAENIARNLTGRPVEVSALNRARAMRQISNEGQDQFVEDYPVQAFIGGVLGGAAMAPARGAAIPGLIGRLGTEAGLGAAYGAAEGDSLSDRLSGAGFGAGVGLALGGAAEVAAPYIGRLVSRFRNRGGSEALDLPALTGQTEAEAALARYRAVNPEDTGARVLNPGDEGYPTNALYDEASQTYVAPRGAAPSYPMAPRSEWYGEANFETTGGRMVDMSPQEYLSSVRPLEIDDVSRENIDDLKRHMESGGTLDPLKIFQGGREDGRHRAVAALEMGFPTVPVVRFDDLPPVEPDYPIRAFHGSPHSFDRFSLDKIGTGEGAQAYGHGLYFAENEGVARGYRDALQQQALSLGGDIVADNPRIARLAKAYPSADSAMQGARDQLARAESALAASTDDLDRMVAEAEINEARAAIADLEPYAGQWFDLTPTGSMYEVGINADPNTFLDWDRPLREQPEPVQRAFGNVVGRDLSVEAGWAGLTGERALGAAVERAGYRGGGEALLREQGINGIRFLDASSRYNPATLPDNPIANEARQWLDAAGGDSAEALRQFNASNPIERFAGPERDEVRKVIEAAARRPTSNYVVFDDELIKILRKYGISGLGLGFGANALGEQMNEAEPNALNGSEDQYQGTALNPL